jgi:hypothetical protein
MIPEDFPAKGFWPCDVDGHELAPRVPFWQVGGWIGLGVLYVLLLVVSFLLLGCTPVGTVRTVETSVPVSVPCNPAPIAVPVWPTQTLPPDAKFYARVRAGFAELKARQAYEKELAAAVEGCRGPVKP